jgi:type IX secretion system substrate protein/Big-like domain-containing protein
MKYLILTFLSIFLSIASFATPGAIIGPTNVCAGSTTTFSDDSLGGTWSSSVTSIAVIGSTSGILAAIGSGTTILTYTTMPGHSVTQIITINSLPTPFVLTLPGGGAYCAGGPGVDITLNGSTPGVTYQLYMGGVAVGLSLMGSGSALDFGYYTAGGPYAAGAIDVTTGCTAGMIGSVTITSNPLPNIYNVTGGGGYCLGGPGVHILLSGSDVGISYQLYVSGIPIGAAIAGTGMPIDFGVQTVVGTYTVVATNATTTCAQNMNGSVTVVVSPLPVAYMVTGGGNYCAGGAGVHIGLTYSDIGINYQLWLNGTTLIATMAGSNSSIDFGTQTAAGVYTIVAVNGGSGCSSNMTGSVTVGIDPLPVAFTVTGGGSYCAGGTGVHIGLNNSNSGIAYQLLLGGVNVGAPIGGTGSTLDFGSQTLAGVYTISATNVITGCQNMMTGSVTITINPAPTAYTVTGGGSYCSGGAGVNVGLSGSVTGINYELYLAGVHTGITYYGTGGGFNFGLQTAAGNYTAVATDWTSGCTSTMTGSANITILPLLTSTITGPSTACVGYTISLTDATPGGTWTSDNTTVATVGSTGIVTGVSGGVANITYNLTGGCFVGSPHVMINVYDMPVITGSANVCSGLTNTLAGSVSGTWSSSNTAVATISTIGGFSSVVTGITVGTCVISLTSGGSCYATTPMSVSALPVITSSSSYGCGDVYTLTSGGGVSYSWTPSTGLSCSTCATTTVNPSATTTFTVTGTDALGCPNTSTVSVNGNRISGFITFGGPTPDTMDMKVWLIQFDPSDSSITALDSTITCNVDSIGYYEFDGKPAGTYLAKAKLIYGNVPGATGYVPTYSLSTPNWYSGATVAHTSGSDSLHMNMIYGIVPTGPGFISGFVYSGAGKGTSSGIPVPGMLVQLHDNSSNALTYTYTDMSGAYSFSGLGYNDYVIYPEDYDYNTVASATISLSSSHPVATAVDFKQFINSRIIVPFTAPSSVATVSNTDAISVYPNPTNGLLNIQWQNLVQGNANVTITDILGREVSKTNLSIDDASGKKQINVNELKDGIYEVSVQSGTIYFSCKLMVQK